MREPEVVRRRCNCEILQATSKSLIFNLSKTGSNWCVCGKVEEITDNIVYLAVCEEQPLRGCERK